jgi:hypothetical protein
MSKIIITRKPIKTIAKGADKDPLEKKRSKKSSVTFDNEDGQMTTADTVKDLSSRWGRAAKYIVKGLPPVIPEFAPLWEGGISAEDPYYDILCREFSYGFFPPNMYFDNHRGVVILSKYCKKKVTKKALKNKSADFVCNTLFGDTMERTTMARNTATNQNNDPAPDEEEEEDPDHFIRERHSEKRILDVINRGVSRGEFLIRELLEEGITYHQLYTELVYYLYKVAGILSPMDANKLRQKEEMKNQLMKEAEENMHISWKKLHVVEKESYWLQYIIHKVPSISRQKIRFLVNWFHVVFLRGDFEVRFEKRIIIDIPGLVLDEHGNIVSFTSENRAKKVAKNFEFILGKYSGFQMTKFWFKDIIDNQSADNVAVENTQTSQMN